MIRQNQFLSFPKNKKNEVGSYIHRNLCYLIQGGPQVTSHFKNEITYFLLIYYFSFQNYK